MLSSITSVYPVFADVEEIDIIISNDNLNESEKGNT